MESPRERRDLKSKVLKGMYVTTRQFPRVKLLEGPAISSH